MYAGETRWDQVLVRESRSLGVCVLRQKLLLLQASFSGLWFQDPCRTLEVGLSVGCLRGKSLRPGGLEPTPQTPAVKMGVLNTLHMRAHVSVIENLRECLTFVHVPTPSVLHSKFSDLTFCRIVSVLSCTHLAVFSGAWLL
jgi:hypothetical protein